MALDFPVVIQELQIPADYSDMEFSVTLQDVEYIFGLQYNTRGEFWALTVMDADRNVRIAGRKIVADWPILTKIPQARIAFGLLMAESKDGATDAPYDMDVFDSGDLSFQFVTLENDG